MLTLAARFWRKRCYWPPRLDLPTTSLPFYIGATRQYDDIESTGVFSMTLAAKFANGSEAQEADFAKYLGRSMNAHGKRKTRSIVGLSKQTLNLL